jgi:hypothetical protein
LKAIFAARYNGSNLKPAGLEFDTVLGCTLIANDRIHIGNPAARNILARSSAAAETNTSRDN